MKSRTRGIAVAVALLLVSSRVDAQALSTGLTIAAPGSTISIPIDLVNPANIQFTSIDAAIKIGESGDTPLILGFDTPASSLSVWEPFGSVTYVPSQNNPLVDQRNVAVLGVSGGDRGVQAKAEGRIMDVTVAVPQSSLPGEEFVIDLIEEFSYIGNEGPVEHFNDIFQDGKLKIVSEDLFEKYQCVETNLFTTESCGDLNSDGHVDGSDFNIVMNEINSITATSAVPEPNLASWFVVAALFLLARRR